MRTGKLLRWLSGGYYKDPFLHSRLTKGKYILDNRAQIGSDMGIGPKLARSSVFEPTLNPKPFWYDSLRVGFLHNYKRNTFFFRCCLSA